jgi:peroxin-6
MSSHLIPNVKWEDIGGLTHVRQEIINTIELPLLHPKLFMNSRRSGILLYGPPGSGKTLVAKAVASECGLPFLNVKGPELLGSYVGESESNIRNIFKSAREAAHRSRNNNGSPGTCVLFFDEIDSLAPNRGDLGDNGGVMDRVVSTLLAEMDNAVTLDHMDNIIVIGATNRPDLLDPSMLRPGRFDRMVYLGLAESRADRIGILAAQTRKFQFDGDVDAYTMACRVIDQIPVSLSGADFSAIASGAMMIALERVCDNIDNAMSLLDYHCSVEDFVRSNKDFDAIPRVTATDLISSASKVIPSVTEAELQRYESLRNEYSIKLDQH